MPKGIAVTLDSTGNTDSKEIAVLYEGLKKISVLHKKEGGEPCDGKMFVIGIDDEDKMSPENIGGLILDAEAALHDHPHIFVLEDLKGNGHVIPSEMMYKCNIHVFNIEDEDGNMPETLDSFIKRTDNDECSTPEPEHGPIKDQ